MLLLKELNDVSYVRLVSSLSFFYIYYIFQVYRISISGFLTIEKIFSVHANLFLLYYNRTYIRVDTVSGRSERSNTCQSHIRAKFPESSNVRAICYFVLSFFKSLKYSQYFFPIFWIFSEKKIFDCTLLANLRP